MSQASLNEGRRLAYETFRATLNELLGQTDVTELRFRDEWLARLSDQQQLTTGGWYEPPPHGIGVLFGHDDAEVPFSFSSLRHEPCWPSERKMNWPRGLMYAYCSPIDVTNGLPGDFGITLYFGRDTNVRRHFATALSLTRDVMEQITPHTMARPLFRYSETLFHNAGMRSNVASVTDSVPVDLGHSLPTIPSNHILNGRHLTPAAKAAIQNGRRFISESADWPLARVGQVTIEPSLISLTNLRLPQVSPHYVVAISEEGINICDECDVLFTEFGLAP